MTKVFEALEKIKEAFGCDPAYYGLNLEFEILHQAITELKAIKEANHNDEENARAFGKDIVSLNKTLKQAIDAPILYFSRCGNKYVVPQELFEKQCNALSIINNKEVNMIRFKAVVMLNGNANDYNKNEEYKERHLTDEEFELIKEMK